MFSSASSISGLTIASTSSFHGPGQPRASNSSAPPLESLSRFTPLTVNQAYAQRVPKHRSPYLIGWRGYFGFCQTPSVLRALDEWIRRRLRAIAWKPWKHGRARFAELRRRGVGRDLAAQTAGSPHGPWRLANSPALNIALPTRSLGSLGLAPVAVPRSA